MTSRIKNIVSAATLTLAAVAVLAPAAQARILVTGPAFGTGAAQQSPGLAVDRMFRDFPTSAPQPAITASDKLTRDFPTSSPVQVPVRVAVSAPATGSGFDWTAAAIGGSLAGLLLIVLGAGMVARGTRAGSLAT